MAEGDVKKNFSPVERVFKVTSKEQRDNILEEKDPKNTKKLTKLWMNCFREYLSQKNLPEPDAIEMSELPDILETFYTEVQKKKNYTVCGDSTEESSYKNTTMRTIRAALARFYREKKSIDIVSNEKFIRCNANFTGLQKINKKKGLGTINRKQLISEEDINKLMEYFRVYIIADLNPQNLQNVLIFYILYYMCRRGRENL